MDYLNSTLSQVGSDVLASFLHNWPYLMIGVVFAAVLRTYVGAERIRTVLEGRRWATVLGAVLLATFTPFCSCGTEAVVLSLMAGSVPWAPIVAFMVASPLTSPEEVVISGGLFGWNFAIMYFVGATVLGILAGFLAGWIEDRGWLKGQARMVINDAEAMTRAAVTEVPAREAVPVLVGPDGETAAVSTNAAGPARTVIPLGSIGTHARSTGARSTGALSTGALSTGALSTGASDCCAPAPVALSLSPTMPSAPADSCCSPTSAVTGPAPAPAPAASSCCSPAPTAAMTAPSTSSCCADDAPPAPVGRWKLRELGRNLWSVGRRIFVFFIGFAAVGYLLLALIPTDVFLRLLGGDSPLAVVFMALLGIPLYLTTDGSLPLIASLVSKGMSQGAAMAFIITGAGTSIGAITGSLVVARWKVVGLVVGILFTGALVMGFLAQAFLDH